MSGESVRGSPTLPGVPALPAVRKPGSASPPSASPPSASPYPPPPTPPPGPPMMRSSRAGGPPVFLTSTPSIANASISVNAVSRRGNSEFHARASAALSALNDVSLDSAKTAAETYYSQYKEAMADNAHLRAAMQQQQADSVQVVQFLESKLREVQAEAVAYKAGITALLENHRAAEEALQTKYGDMIRERDGELLRYAALTAKLHDDLQQASRYVQQRHEHAIELRQLQDQLEELAVAHEKEVAALHFQTVDRKLKLIALEKTMRAEFDALVAAEATKALEERFQSVLERTRSLESEKVAMTHDIDNLMQLTTRIDAERVQIRRQAAVQQQAQRELAQHALSRGRQKEQADLKIYQLEERVRALTAQHARQLSEVEARYETRVRTLEAELAATRASLHRHRAELQQMRQLTAKVVGERSELENFFHTALADCQRFRQSMAPLNATGTGAAAAGATTMKGTLSEKLDWGSDGNGAAAASSASLNASTTNGSAAGAALGNNGMYFEQLSWRDKEKIIKSLLFFLNANYYRGAAGGGAAATDNNGDNGVGHFAAAATM